MKRLFSLSLIVVIVGTLSAQTLSSLKIPTIPRQMFWQNSPKVCTMKGGILTITAGEKTDLFRDPSQTYNVSNAPQLLFKADENFVFTAAVEHPFTTKWDAGGLVLSADSLNWVKFGFEKDYTGAHRIVSVVTKGLSDDANGLEIDGTQTWLRIAKAGNAVMLYQSNNGKKWFLIRHIFFEAKKGANIGFIAQSPEGKSNTVKFSDIKYESRKIADPYSGE